MKLQNKNKFTSDEYYAIIILVQRSETDNKKQIEKEYAD
jgi:hypothetical protein